MKTIFFFRSFPATLAVIICIAFSADRTWSQPCTNVKDAPFFAKGDGFSDDTEAIRKAFAEATACVFFPAGVYLIDPGPERSMAVLKSGLTVQGEPGKSVLKLRDTSIVPQASSQAEEFECMLLGREPVITSSGSLQFPLINNITVKGLVFDCNYRGNQCPYDQATRESTSILFFKIANLTVQNCVFVNAGSICIGLIECQKSILKDNYLYDVGQGRHNADAIQANGCKDTQIFNNLLENVGEGIFCQHLNAPPVSDSAAAVHHNTISTLEFGERSSIRNHIDSLTLLTMKAGGIMQYNSPGKARGSGIGILSNNSKVHNNTIKRHNGISIKALRGQGNLPTIDVEVFNNTITQNAAIQFFNEKQDRMIRIVNGALVVSAVGQTVSKVNIHGNTVNGSFNSGFDLVVANDTLRGDSVAGTIDELKILQNKVFSACKAGDIAKCAAIDFRNGNLAASKKNMFKNVVIQGNHLGYANKFGLWLEPCMANVKIVQNTFSGSPGSVGKVFAGNGSCLQLINQPNTFTQAQLDCLLKPGGTCTGCTSNPANCAPSKKCASCN